MSQATVTYCPESNCLRLYVGRVPRDEYDALRAAGFKATPKQSCDFVATWTPAREDLASEYLEDGEDIGDEDYSPEERAADRAERFSGYRDKRLGEAVGSADTFDAGPSAFGHQSRARAERQASRHDRTRTRAVSQWSKAEYWQERTAGVISHALYKSSAHVRRGRILELEAGLRKIIADYTPQDPPHYINQQVYCWTTREYKYDGAEVPHVWCGPKGRGGRWVEVASLERLQAGYARWVAHYELRLTYERAMLDAEGGTAAAVEMEPGGWIGRHQIQKVNKSPATGRVVSVGVMGQHPWRRNADGTPEIGVQVINIERLAADVYRAPTDEERATFKAGKKANKKPTVSIINPTDEDAERLQSLLNQQAAEHAASKNRGTPDARTVERITQAKFSAYSGPDSLYHVHAFTFGAETFKVRVRNRGFVSYDAAYTVVILADKPQKPLPAAVFLPVPVAVETPVEETACV